MLILWPNRCISTQKRSFAVKCTKFSVRGGLSRVALPRRRPAMTTSSCHRRKPPRPAESTAPPKPSLRPAACSCASTTLQPPPSPLPPTPSPSQASDKTSRASPDGKDNATLAPPLGPALNLNDIQWIDHRMTDVFRRNETGRLASVNLWDQQQEGFVTNHHPQMSCRF